MDLELAGKSVVVTGGGSNIGRAIVLQFAEEGANITIGDIDTASAEKVAKLAIERGAADAQVVKTDVTNIDDVNALFNAATSKYGSLDALPKTYTRQPVKALPNIYRMLICRM